MGLRLRVVLLMAVAASGGLMATVASAASTSKTSVALQFASHTSFNGRVSSPKAGCARSRVIRLQMREGRKWVSIATVKSNHSGRFHGTLRRGGGRYRAVATEIDSYLAYVGIDSVTSLWNVTPPGQNGAPGNLEYEEFTATFQGNPELAQRRAHPDDQPDQPAMAELQQPGRELRRHPQQPAAHAGPDDRHLLRRTV